MQFVAFWGGGGLGFRGLRTCGSMVCTSLAVAQVARSESKMQSAQSLRDEELGLGEGYFFLG